MIIIVQFHKITLHKVWVSLQKTLLLNRIKLKVLDFARNKATS